VVRYVLFDPTAFLLSVPDPTFGKRKKEKTSPQTKKNEKKWKGSEAGATLESAAGTKIPKKWGGGGREREQEIRVPKETWKKWTRDRERERESAK
jgi:hypothetical protein